MNMGWNDNHQNFDPSCLPMLESYRPGRSKKSLALVALVRTELVERALLIN